MANRKKDLTWRYQPSVDSDKAKLLSYIQNQKLHPNQDKTAMIINALTSYYMPVALHSEGSYSQETLELLLLDSAMAFANQLKYLCAVLNVEPMRVGSVLCSAFPISNPDYKQAKVSDAARNEIVDELDDFDPQAWNLSGITTDSETFEFIN
ncbi:hypothetical protein IQ264_04435 [Phormidium sp. LEGE 05292]|uniref:hypothetical protein n=1 Tax=[Phormidium] sp. LEGE 05292 TaxID=767427 RepID=UPI001880A7D4|nr:hypothetical protein [Phormidium sp. LEGE 05292]MBE9224715.1 hypothetical protein [Phormidium sp. LEGE 05292]